jgi:Uma2 family endonuclease
MKVRVMAVAVQPRLFNVDEYYAMGEAGVFAPGERVELLDGEILSMPPIGPRQTGGVNRLNAFLAQQFGRRAIVQVQNPVRLSNDSEPEPDIALLRPSDDFYSARHALPDDVFALIEVADTSLSYDRGRKLKAYARSGIAEYWIVNVRDNQLEVYRQPSGDDYAQRIVRNSGEAIAFASFPDDVLQVDDLLGT